MRKVLTFPLEMQGKIAGRVLFVKQWIELKEAEIYQHWYNKNVAPTRTYDTDFPSEFPDEILNLRTITPKGQSRPLKLRLTEEQAANLDKWRGDTDDVL